MSGEVLGRLIALIDELLWEISHRPIGYHPGSRGDISTQIGYDVRDLIVMGYSKRQIYSVVEGEITLEELLHSVPENMRR
ncbi:MAG: hypothetical protein ACK2UK_20945 [Candidatus Promineifilaceae bacterium]|jgi:hypothetical protein